MEKIYFYVEYSKIIIKQKKGDIEDHCNLLCSLFLGFGLDAYVVVGTNNNGNHFWVLQLMND